MPVRSGVPVLPLAAGLVVVPTAVTALWFGGHGEEVAGAPAAASPSTGHGVPRPTAAPVRPTQEPARSAGRDGAVRESPVGRGAPAESISAGVAVDPVRGPSFGGGPRVDVLVG
ncbi:hypothetical protein ACFFSW_16465 [Saccharothrix longispora]|uniref:Uncharacterized protein n=1 Tax=Saccharothrix longispora TaxID=33920 RepID=A0ABU1Q038_9PSEU|nr:hypothetical protein [Saccharothrix longispora]MDR6596260.1 hypothetical protein [Saccharothrix longispora]